MPQKVKKPITVARRDYMSLICEATNTCGLPAFVIVEVLENILNQMRPAMDAELKRDEAAYRATLQRTEEKEVDQDVGSEN